MDVKENKLGTMPIGRLLLNMSVPMMISMLVQALYNMVDSMFVARISEEALTAVAMAFPMQNMMSAIGVGTGVGMSALVSRSLGQGNPTRAEKAANVQVFLSACYTLAFVIIGAFFVRRFYTSQTQIESIVDYGVEYLSVVCLWSVGCFFGQNLEKLLTATGYSALSMVAQISGALFNILFDWLLIFGVGPFPELGVRGAAIATVMGQIFAALLALVFNLRYNHAVRLRFYRMLPDRDTIKKIYAVGIPSMLTIGLGSVMNYCVNQILLGFSTTATAVFGIWMKMQSFAFMPVYGMNNGTIAIYSYNYGAKYYHRVRGTLKLALKLGLCITLAVMGLYEALPRLMLRLFSASDYMYAIGIPALRLCSLSLPFGAAALILSSCCQTMGRARYTLFVNFLRHLGIQVLAMWLLSLSGVLTLVWFAPLIAEAGAMTAAIFLSRRVLQRLDAPKD